MKCGGCCASMRRCLLCNLEAMTMDVICCLGTIMISSSFGLGATALNGLGRLEEKDCAGILDPLKKSGRPPTVTTRSLVARRRKQVLERLDLPWTNSETTVRQSHTSVRWVRISTESTLGLKYSFTCVSMKYGPKGRCWFVQDYLSMIGLMTGTTKHADTKEQEGDSRMKHSIGDKTGSDRRWNI